MSARIRTGRNDFARLLGDKFYDELTFPKIFKDSVDSIAPVIIENGDDYAVVIGDFDAAAFQAATRQVQFETFGRYFDWNRAGGAQPQSFAAAVRRLAGDGELTTDGAMPVGRFEALAATGQVSIADERPNRPIYIYRKSRRELEAQWQSTRDGDVPALRPFVSTLRFGPDLIDGMTSEALGFEILDNLCAASGLGAIYVTSAFNAEMFTGLPYGLAAQIGLGAIYVPDEADITVLSYQPISRADFIPLGRAASVAEACKRVQSVKIGVERENLTISVYRHLENAGFQLADATYPLRRWQDERAGTDLLYFITAANAVLHGVEHAKAFMARRLASGSLESEVAAIFHQGVQQFAHRVGMGGRVHPYFDIIHSGERTLLPAIAGDYPLNERNRTIKFDMGLLVTDAFGCVRGCSDIARTISPESGLQDAHDQLRALLVDELIPSIRSGMNGGEIHAKGVEILRPMTEPLKNVGLLHSDMTMDGYTRDCGHTLQRQTLATVHFLPGYKETLHTGMLGCTEFVWPIDDKIVAAEDGYYVTAKGAVPFTI